MVSAFNSLHRFLKVLIGIRSPTLEPKPERFETWASDLCSSPLLSCVARVSSMGLQLVFGIQWLYTDCRLRSMLKACGWAYRNSRSYAMVD